MSHEAHLSLTAAQSILPRQSSHSRAHLSSVETYPPATGTHTTRPPPLAGGGDRRRRWRGHPGAGPGCFSSSNRIPAAASALTRQPHPLPATPPAPPPPPAPAPSAG